MALPAPMTPPDCDLRGLVYMPLDVTRLLDSDLMALSTGDEFKAALCLWLKAWGQVPAASLPDDERLLARFCGVSLGEWRTLAPRALHGWTKCADGRLYHAVVAEKALTAWIDRLAHRKRSAAGHAKRYGRELDLAPIEAASKVAFDMLLRLAPAAKAETDNLPQADPETASSSDHACQGHGFELRSGVEWSGDIPVGTQKSVEPENPDKEAWRRAPALLSGSDRMTEAKARKLFGRILSDHKLDPRDLLPSIVAAEGKGTPDPQGYLVAAAKAVADRRRGGRSQTDVGAWGEPQWRVAMDIYRTEGTWGDGMGPRPGEPGCIVPTHLLERAA